MNPLYEMMSGGQAAGQNNIVQRFLQFKKSFSGNPQMMVQQLLNSGKVSQERYNQAVQMANQLSKIINQ